jgi:L-2-hydroxyglutarate oxidase LhgO
MAGPDFDSVVIGAGAVGLAVAARLAAAGQSVLVLETADHPGDGISSRNSEVIHSGIYYPTGSLKHRLCLRGRQLLYAFLDGRGLPHRKCGKIIVATDAAERAGIEALFHRGRQNGVEGLDLIDGAEVARMEPEVRAVAGLWSPETGIFDSHQVLLALIAEIEAGGGHVAPRSPFEAAEAGPAGFTVQTGGADPARLTAARLINCAGLTATAAARRIAGLDAATIPQMRYAKGSYFSLTGPAPFTRLIYPAPVDGGLGIHATLDLAGQVRFGPDVEWCPAGTRAEALDYRVDPGRAALFAAAVRRYWPGIDERRLVPDYAGIRPKLSGPGEPPADFAIRGPADHGCPGLVNLYGIESPGLTSALAIAEHVMEILGCAP